MLATESVIKIAGHQYTVWGSCTGLESTGYLSVVLGAIVVRMSMSLLCCTSSTGDHLFLTRLCECWLVDRVSGWPVDKLVTISKCINWPPLFKPWVFGVGQLEGGRACQLTSASPLYVHFFVCASFMTSIQLLSLHITSLHRSDCSESFRKRTHENQFNFP